MILPPLIPRHLIMLPKVENTVLKPHVIRYQYYREWGILAAFVVCPEIVWSSIQLRVKTISMFVVYATTGAFEMVQK